MASSCSDIGCFFGFEAFGESIESTIESILCSPAERKNDSHAPDKLFLSFLALHWDSLRHLVLPGPMQLFHCTRICFKSALHGFRATCRTCLRDTGFAVACPFSEKHARACACALHVATCLSCVSSHTSEGRREVEVLLLLAKSIAIAQHSLLYQFGERTANTNCVESCEAAMATAIQEARCSLC